MYDNCIIRNLTRTINLNNDLNNLWKVFTNRDTYKYSSKYYTVTSLNKYIGSKKVFQSKIYLKQNTCSVFRKESTITVFWKSISNFEDKIVFHFGNTVLNFENKIRHNSVYKQNIFQCANVQCKQCALFYFLI